MTISERLDIELIGVIPQKYKDEGWHFCAEWDFALVGPNDPEKDVCICN